MDYKVNQYVSKTPVLWFKNRCMKFLIFGFPNLLEQLFNGVKLEKLSHKHDCLKDSILINESDGNSLQLKYYDCKIKVKYLVLTVGKPLT